MPGQSSKLTEKRVRTANMMLEGFTHAKIAQELGVSSRTVERWVKHPVVQNALTEAKQNALRVVKETTEDRYRKIVEQSLGLGLTTVVGILRNPDSHNRDKLKCVELLSKWYGLDAPTRHQIEIGVEQQLDATLAMLQGKMSREAFDELVSALVTSSAG